MRHLVLRLSSILIALALILPPAALTAAAEQPAQSPPPVMWAEEVEPPFVDPEPLLEEEPADEESPSVTLTLSDGQADPTNAATISFTAVFSEPVIGFGNEDVELTGTAGADLAIVTDTGDEQTYAIDVTGMNTPGTVVVSIPADAVLDAAGNLGLASDPVSVNFDAIRPSVTISPETGQLTPTNNPTMAFKLVFSKTVTGLEVSDLTAVNALAGSIALSGSGTTYSVTLTAVANGAVTLSVANAAAQDGIGNASLPGQGTLTYDIARPTATARTPASGATLIANNANMIITFSEPVTGLTAANVILRNMATNTVVPSALSYDAGTRRLTINPASDLAHVRSYRVELNAGIRDYVGNTFAATSWQFTTAGKVYFGAGTHTGVKFNSSGAIIASKKITLTTASSATASARKWYSGKGVYLYITNGALAGYWLKETSISYLPGLHSYAAYSGKVSFSVGRYSGLPINMITGATGTRKTTLHEIPVSYVADATGIINGLSHYRLTAGPLKGLWVRLTSANVAYRDNAALPSCAYANILTPYRAYGDWSRSLLDLRYMVPSTYRPTDLVPVTNSGARYGSYGVPYARNIMMTDLKALVAAVRNAGYGQLQINTAFRDYNTQAGWWNNYVRNGGSKTYPTTLPPGHSEHQLGTTLDINVYAKAGLNAWMAANAWKYGFVKSYPGGKNAKHCIGTEDWHYRYYGRTVASSITKSGMSPREWLWYARH